MSHEAYYTMAPTLAEVDECHREEDSPLKFKGDRGGIERT